MRIMKIRASSLAPLMVLRQESLLRVLTRENCVIINILAVDTGEVTCSALSPSPAPHLCLSANTHVRSAAQVPVTSLHSQLAAIWPSPGETGEYLKKKVDNLSF